MKTIASILFVLGIFTSKVIACDCANIPFLEAIEVMDEIFIGTVVNIERSSEYVEEHNFTIGYTVYTFEVSKKWKGSSSNKVKIIEYDTSCSIGHELGEESLIYGELNEKKSTDSSQYYWADMCSRTINIKYLSDPEYKDWIWDDRDSLDIKFPHPVQTVSIIQNWVFIIILVFSVAIFGLILHFLRKRSAL